MVKKIFEWDNNGNIIPFYLDELMEDNKVLRGRKSNSDATFIITNKKTMDILYGFHISEQRDKILEMIL